MTPTEWIFIGVGLLLIGVVVLLVLADRKKRAKWADEKAKKDGTKPVEINEEKKPASKTRRSAKRAEVKEGKSVRSSEKGSDEDWLTKTYSSGNTSMAALLKQEAEAIKSEATSREDFNRANSSQAIYGQRGGYERSQRLRSENMWNSEIFNSEITGSRNQTSQEGGMGGRATQSTAKENPNYNKTTANKSLSEQINELTPEMKALLFADVLKPKNEE
ncbi:MAG: hypothetical protein FWE53_02055 [Firmicutes bacterium]|nr:hypothetical protein [Bacillota bacterium]